MTNSLCHSEIRARILLVDDENSVRDSLCTLLEDAGHEVLTASNGPDGLSIFRKSVRPIELLVTDFNMPQMSGLELALECSCLYRELGVLYVSGSCPEEELQSDLQKPKRGFLAKPFRGNDLLRKVRELLLTKTTTTTEGRVNSRATPKCTSAEYICRLRL